MMKNPLWRQATPLDQLVVLRMSLDGELDNFRTGVTTRDVFVARGQDLLDQMEALHPFLATPFEWPEQD